jgi:hypothetical protein
MVEEGNAWTESHRSSGQKWLPIHQQLCNKQNRATGSHYQADPDNQGIPSNCRNRCCCWRGAKRIIIRLRRYANGLLLQSPQQSNSCRSPVPTTWASFTGRENASLIPSQFSVVAIQYTREFNQERSPVITVPKGMIADMTAGKPAVTGPVSWNKSPLTNPMIQRRINRSISVQQNSTWPTDKQQKIGPRRQKMSACLFAR